MVTIITHQGAVPTGLPSGWVAWVLLVQDGILMLPELVDHRLYPQHEELIPQMEAELQVILGISKEGPDSLTGLSFHQSHQWILMAAPVTVPPHLQQIRLALLQVPESQERVGGDIFSCC